MPIMILIQLSLKLIIYTSNLYISSFLQHDNMINCYLIVFSSHFIFFFLLYFVGRIHEYVLTMNS